MKRFLLLFSALLGAAQILFAQEPGMTFIRNLPEVQIAPQADVHFVSPEPIQYADISSHSITGDMPVSNLLRVRLVPDSLRLLSSGGSAGVITIVGESFIAQYRLTFAGSASQQLPSAVEIQPSQCRPLDFPGITLTTGEMKRFALRILESGEKSAVSKTRAYGITACLNHVYTVGDHIFLDLSFRNDSNLPYDIDELRFKIEDKKINKATNEQSLEIKPEWQLYPPDRFRQEYHNIYVFKKVTFPDDKILRIGLSEKQVSGRTITLQVKYADLLRADHL